MRQFFRIIQYVLIIIVFSSCHSFIGKIINPPRRCPCCYENNNTYCIPQNEPFRGDHDDTYRCGLMYSQCGLFDDALKYFDKAIQLRSDDSRYAKLFGMHFFPYFPNREKGIVYYKLGHYSQAFEALTLSNSQDPTDKTLYYLDKVRQALMKQTIKEPTTPTLHLNQPVEIMTNETVLTISGMASDDNYIQEIILTHPTLYPLGKHLFMASAQKQVVFHEEIPLDQEQCTMTLSAKNLLGKRTQKIMHVRVDRSAPSISITSFEKGVYVSGYLSDASGEITWTVNQDIPHYSKGNKIPFTLSIQGLNKVVLMARDPMGNQTTMDLSQMVLLNAIQYPMYAQNQGTIASDEGQASSDRQFMSDMAQTRAYVQSAMPNKPQITLENWSLHEIVWFDSIMLELTIQSSSCITSVTMNNNPLFIQKGLIIHLKEKVRLTPGENRFMVHAWDQSGQDASIEVVIFKMTPDAERMIHAFTIQLEKVTHIFSNESEQLPFKDIFLDNVIQSNRFLVKTKDIHPLIKQHLINQKTAISDYQASINDAIIDGVIHVTQNSENHYSMEAFMRLTLTNNKIISFDGYHIGSSNDLVREYNLLAHRLIGNLKKRCPRFKGKVIQVNGDEIHSQSAWTQEEKEQWKLPFYFYQYITRHVPQKNSSLKYIGDNQIIVQKCKPVRIDYDNQVFIFSKENQTIENEDETMMK